LSNGKQNGCHLLIDTLNREIVLYKRLKLVLHFLKPYRNSYKGSGALVKKAKYFVKFENGFGSNVIFLLVI